MRRSPLDEGLRWLEQAEEDLRWARLLAREGGHHLACFLAQQVAEKALKAYLYAQGEELVLGHAVDSLCARAAAHEAAFAAGRRRWAILDSHYVPTRYPNALPDGIPARVYNREAAEEAVALAGDVVATVDRLLRPLAGGAEESAGNSSASTPGDAFVPYEEEHHTADWALRARGRTLAELFVNAARGMYALMAEALPAAAPLTRTVEVEAASAEGLLVAWLNELLYLTEREGIVFTAFRVEKLTLPAEPPAVMPGEAHAAAPAEVGAGEAAPARLRATAAGDRARASLRKYIKAATYHNLTIERRDGLHDAVVVFDV